MPIPGCPHCPRDDFKSASGRGKHVAKCPSRKPSDLTLVSGAIDTQRETIRRARDLAYELIEQPPEINKDERAARVIKAVFAAADDDARLGLLASFYHDIHVRLGARILRTLDAQENPAA